MKKQKLPIGWTEKRVRQVLEHYESQSEDEQHAEIETALKAKDFTLIAVPTKLANEVRKLIARKRIA